MAGIWWVVNVVGHQLETLRLVYAIQYPYNPDTRVGEGNLTKFLTSDYHIVKVF